MGEGFAVTISGLEVRRGKRPVIEGLDLGIHEGKVTGLLGPSGCGNTTLLRCIVGVQRLHAGTVTVLGEPAGARSLRKRVAYDTQAASVYRDLTVEQNIAYFARVLGAPRGDVARVMHAVGLDSSARQLAGGLSGGQEKRVSLAVALLGEPELIVLDEPTVGLDPVLRAELWDAFRTAAAAGATLLVSSHVMDEASRCDRLLLMRDGALLADTTPAELARSTGEHDAEAAFLALVRGTARSAEPVAEPASDPSAEIGDAARTAHPRVPLDADEPPRPHGRHVA